ncbi:hypothetical protein G6F31_021243 [Rhizopus arrhizus]|nr:hypothetical protein G6F31_021243 [Rhizopus arrhizus]
MCCAVGKEEARLQLGRELPADVCHRALAVATGMVLVTVEFGIGVGQEVVDIATDTPPADPALLVATAAGFVMQLHARRITAAAADVVDGTADHSGSSSS